MSQTTREQLLVQAQTLFSQRGFYGVSIAAVAEALGLSKQALLHHFGSKEKLYGEVLLGVSGEIESLLNEIASQQTTAESKFHAVLEALLKHSFSKPEQTTLLMRELLDNKRRADSARSWYLKPFLKRLTALLGQSKNWQQATESELLAGVYMLLGSFNYALVSAPTLQAIYGKSAHKRFESLIIEQHKTLVDAVLLRPETANR